MSLGYAEKLSYIEDVGKVGMTEHFDPPHVLQEKVGTFCLSFSFWVLGVAYVFLSYLVFRIMMVLIFWNYNTHERYLGFVLEIGVIFIVVVRSATLSSC